MCALGAFCCLCSVLSPLAPVHRCARLAYCVACAVSWATWLLFIGVPARCAVLCMRCPGPLGSRSPVCPLGALLCLCGVLGHLVPVHWCACSRCCLCVQCPAPLGSCSPVCPLGVLFCLCGVLGHLALGQLCACWMRCFACAVSWATWPLFTSVPARCGACLCGVLGHLAISHRCSRSVCCFACAVSCATWLLFTSVPARRVVLRVRCPGPLGSCSPMCALGVLCCMCGVLCHLAPVHRCARSVCCVACAVSWATWHLFTGVPARCVALRVRCPGPLGSCSPVCPLGVLPVCAVPWTTWLLFTGVPARCVVLLVRCPGPFVFCSPVCLPGALLCVCGVLGHLAPVHRCARSVRCFVCALSWATWLLFTGVLARCVVLLVLCPGPLGSCPPVCPLGALPVCAVSWATWLLFTGVPAWCVVLLVRCPGPLGFCSPVCPFGVLCGVCGVLGHLAPIHQCARSVCCVACAVSWAFWLLFTGALPGVLGGVLGHLAPVHRYARSVCCAVGCVCAASLPGAHSSIRTVAFCSRQGLGTLRARTPPSRRRLFVASRGLVPSGHTHVHPDGGCSVAGGGWVRCRAHTRPSGWQLVLFGTCLRAVVRCVLCALSGFAAPGDRRCLAPVCVPWFWWVACLSGVPRGPALCAAPRPFR